MQRQLATRNFFFFFFFLWCLSLTSSALSHIGQARRWWRRIQSTFIFNHGFPQSIKCHIKYFNFLLFLVQQLITYQTKFYFPSSLLLVPKARNYSILETDFFYYCENKISMIWTRKEELRTFPSVAINFYPHALFFDLIFFFSLFPTIFKIKFFNKLK